MAWESFKRNVVSPVVGASQQVIDPWIGLASGVGDFMQYEVEPMLSGFERDRPGEVSSWDARQSAVDTAPYVSPVAPADSWWLTPAPAAPVMTREQMLAEFAAQVAAEDAAAQQAAFAEYRAFTDEGVADYRDMVMSQFDTPLDFSNINSAELSALQGNSSQYDAAAQSIDQVYANAIGSMGDIAGSMSSAARGASAETQALYAGLAADIAANNDAVANEMAAVYGIDGGVSGDAVDSATYAGSEAQVRASEIMNDGNVQADLVRTMAAAMPQYQANQSVAAQRIMAARDLGIRSKYADVRMAEQSKRDDDMRDALARVADMEFQANRDAAQFEMDRRSTPSERQQLIDAMRLDEFSNELKAVSGGSWSLPDFGAATFEVSGGDAPADVTLEPTQVNTYAIEARRLFDALVNEGEATTETARIETVNQIAGEILNAYGGNYNDAARVNELVESFLVK